MKYFLPAIFLLCMGSAPVYGIEGYKTKQKIKTEQPDTRKLDELSVWAYMSAVTGIASFFFMPAISLLLFPAALVMGLIALKDRRRLEERRGKGLAIAAVILGGVYTALFAITFTIFLFAF